MRPEDIQNHDFLVGIRGYDKDEVRSFLAQVAAEHAALLAAVEQGEVSASSVRPEVDDFESLGAGVAAILRTAKESATEITSDAEIRAAALREEAEQVRTQAQESARAMRDAALAETEGAREQARRQVADARAEAERLVNDAAERVRQIELEHEARMRSKADDVARREAAVRQRLLEAADELQLALVALTDESQPVETNHQEHRAPALG